MSSRLLVTQSACIVLAAAIVSGLTAPAISPALASKSVEVVNHRELINLLNASKDTALGAMMEKLKAMNHSEISRLMNETFGLNHTLTREGKQFGLFGGGGLSGFGGFGGGGISPLLLALFLGRDRDRGFGGFGGGFPAPAPAAASGLGSFGDLATVASLTLLGLALIARMPTQG
ncbi:hypothetical protein BV898_14949 [Hypsibius exemplaris]|uniref:SXP/RAL-2 family protein Ani s 5-like cation-binding domain-containing protein n=1 Tax=Hypsibius exemplaris TaxID=2072580 RepID=A0A9X6N9N1_HYPEX|nr:hypothetical protein BV898_14949 [Hypsibius exemplaris]